MARRLESDGQEVAFLGVVDVGPGYRGDSYSRKHPPESPWFGLPMPAEPDWPLKQRVRYYGSLAKRRPKAFGRHLMKRWGLDQWILPVVWQVDLRRRGQVRAGHRLWYAWYHHWRLAGPDWHPSPYGGDLTLFWAQGTGSVDATMGWEDWVAGTVDVRRIQVSHMDVMGEDHVGALASVLRGALDDTIERQDS
jgi:hypothetical protein